MPAQCLYKSPPSSLFAHLRPFYVSLVLVYTLPFLASFPPSDDRETTETRPRDKNAQNRPLSCICQKKVVPLQPKLEKCTLMRLKVKNVNKISQADVYLNGLTVVVGPNNSGKSTIGRTLFTTIKAIANTNVPQDFL